MLMKLKVDRCCRDRLLSSLTCKTPGSFVYLLWKYIGLLNGAGVVFQGVSCEREVRDRL